MKKYIGFIALAGFMFSLSLGSLAKAEDNGTTNPRPDFNNTLGEKRDAFRDDMKARREAFVQSTAVERKAFVDDLKAKRDAFMVELKAKKEEWKEANKDKKVKFCQGAREMLENRFRMAITQLEKHQSKVGEVIAKLKADLKDTSVAEAALSLSKQKLADAKAKLAEVKALVPEGGCENMTPEIFEKIKLGAREAKDLLKESREALHEAIKAVKDLREENKDGDENENN
jgi:hypothetical protein